MNRTSNAKIFFYILFIALLLMLAFMMKPIVHPIIFGGIIAGSFYPLFLRISRIPKVSRNIASILTTVIIVLIVFIPSVFIIMALSKESIALYNDAKDYFFTEEFTGLFTPENRLYAAFTSFLSEIGIDWDLNALRAGITSYAQQFSGYVLRIINSWISNVLGFLFDFIIMLLIIFTLFSQGDKLKAFVFKLSPLPDDQEQLLLENFNQMNYVTIVCNGLGGLIQGVMAGFGFWIAGIPSVILWTVIMTFLAFIPLVGISLVYIPAVLFLAFIGKTWTAIILFVYCTAISLIVENWFKPRFIGQRIKSNSLFILLCIIGGMSFFGILGIFYGPLIGIVFLTLVQLYHTHYLDSSEKTG
ncbi:MAG: AI-2E family transporter [Spirochaetes bacterium]|nr:AI-2E family transporter [Spirochaetota bacterium]